MRRNPLAIASVLGAFYAFYVLRGLGRALAAIIMGLPVTRVMIYRVLPGFDVFSDAWEMAPSRLATLILAGPACALLAGYLLLVLIGSRGKRLPSQLLLFLCMTSYVSLILDPIYYAVIPLLRLGGEPETLAWVLDVSRIWVALPAMAVLGLNVMLTRRRLVPLIKDGPGA
jgi:hypothetical protein